MTLANEISKAIETHWQWKVRLHSAIDNGTSDFNSARSLTVPALVAYLDMLERLGI
jgi:hypothetical protein